MVKHWSDINLEKETYEKKRELHTVWYKLLNQWKQAYWNAIKNEIGKTEKRYYFQENSGSNQLIQRLARKLKLDCTASIKSSEIQEQIWKLWWSYNRGNKQNMHWINCGKTTRIVEIRSIKGRSKITINPEN